MPDTWSDMSDISATTVTVAQLGRRISGVQKIKEINDKGEKNSFYTGDCRILCFCLSVFYLMAP